MHTWFVIILSTQTCSETCWDWKSYTTELKIFIETPTHNTRAKEDVKLNAPVCAAGHAMSRENELMYK